MSLEMSREDVRDGAIYFEDCFGFRRPERKTEQVEGLGSYARPAADAKPSEKAGDLDQHDGRRTYIKHQLPGTRRMTEGLRACTSTGDPCSVPAPTTRGSRALVTLAPGHLMISSGLYVYE